MHLHRMKVVNYDESTNDERNSEEKSKSIKHKHVSKKACNDYIVKNVVIRGERGDEPTHLKSKNSLYQQKLNSGVGDIPNKGKNPNTRLLKNVCLGPILKKKILLKKNNSSSAVDPYNFVGNLKNTCSNWKSKSVKYVENGKRNKKDEEVKVLFKNDVSKTAKLSKNHNSKNGLIHKKSKSTYDIFGLKNRNRLLPTRYTYNVNCEHMIKPNTGMPLITSDNLCSCCPDIQQLDQRKSSSLRNARSRSSSRFHLPTQHNITDVPNPAAREIKRRKLNKLHKNETQIQCQFKDQQVSVSPSYLQTRSIANVAVTTSDGFSIKTLTKTNAYIQKVCESKTNKIKQLVVNPSNQCVETVPELPVCSNLPQNRQTMKESIIKYILFSLIFIAWLPCIFVILVCWTLTYPLRPHSNNTTNLTKKQGECMPTSNNLSWRTRFNPILFFITRIVQQTFYFSKVIASLLNNKTETHRSKHRPHLTVCQSRSQKKRPNPNKQYTLFYAVNRGWVLKPLPSQLHGRKTHIVNSLHQMLYYHDPKDQDKNHSSKSILKKQDHYGCRCNNTMKKVTIELPDNADNKPQPVQSLNKMSHQISEELELIHSQLTDALQSSQLTGNNKQDSKLQHSLRRKSHDQSSIKSQQLTNALQSSQVIDTTEPESKSNRSMLSCKLCATKSHDQSSIKSQQLTNALQSSQAIDIIEPESKSNRSMLSCKLCATRSQDQSSIKSQRQLRDQSRKHKRSSKTLSPLDFILECPECLALENKEMSEKASVQESVQLPLVKSEEIKVETLDTDKLQPSEKSLPPTVASSSDKPAESLETQELQPSHHTLPDDLPQEQPSTLPDNLSQERKGSLESRPSKLPESPDKAVDLDAQSVRHPSAETTLSGQIKRCRKICDSAKSRAVCKPSSYEKLDGKKSRLKFIKIKRGKQKLKAKNKILCFCKTTTKKVKEISDDADAQVWCDDVMCKSKKGPFFFLFRCCPAVYPVVRGLISLVGSVFRMLIYVISGCIWCPILFFVYSCCKLICECRQ